MAGHSKWANIQHRKKAQDSKRGKLFTKLIREITVAARMGGGDADSNPRLRAAIDKALTANMTRDTVERAVKRGVGGDDTSNLEEIVYEGYGPGGVAIIVECMTDNRNRTVGEVRHAFSKCGGNLGTSGSVAYMFNRRGQLIFAPGTDEEALMEVALEVGVEDIQAQHDGSIEVLTGFEDYLTVKEALVAAGFSAEQSDITMLPDNMSPVDAETAPQLLKLIDMLDDLDDTQNVYSNADIADEILEQL